MIFLSRLRPTDVRPELLINREQEASWLKQSLSAYLADRDPSRGQAFCVMGSKGVGKSILTRKVLSEIREVHAGTTLFVTVDCRGKLKQRAVLKQITEKIHLELVSMHKHGILGIGPEMVANAAALATIAGFDEVERTHIREFLTEYKVAANLALGGEMLSFLQDNFQLSLGRKKKEVLSGSIKFDDDKLREALIFLLRDIRQQHDDIDVVIYLDNIDELDHDAYQRENTREILRKNTLGLLDLWRAPIGLVLNMRTYFSSILLREVSKRLSLQPMDRDDLIEVLKRRLDEEPEHIREVLTAEPWSARIEQLADMAATPLCFLMWFEFVAERMGKEDTGGVREKLMEYPLSHVATISMKTLKQALSVFDSPDATVSRGELLKACGDKESVLAQLVYAQVVLPRDFWDPNEFTLDPEMHFMLETSGS